jgi:hypothetical protein
MTLGSTFWEVDPMTRVSPLDLRTNRRAFLRTGLLLGGVVVGTSLLAACQPTPPPRVAPTNAPAPALATAPAPAQLPRKETLYVAGWQWGPPTTFNPLATGLAGWPTQGAPNTPLMHVFETLLAFNMYSGALEP